MPHSSGGGGHGGGGHGGSGGSSTRTSSHYFPGSHRYVYYDDATRRPVVTYANYDVTKGNRVLYILILVIFAPMLLMCTIGISSSAIHYPAKLKTNYDTKIVIEDNAKVISGADEIRLRRTLKDFQDETGITPAVVTVYNEDWKKKYSDLEKYAYDLYLDMFDDEKHWLIVYSQPKKPDPSFNDWYWEGMQGNNTDPILSTVETGRFNKRLQKNLLKNDVYTPGEAINDAFEDLTPHVMDHYVRWKEIIVAFAFFGVFGAGLIVFFVISLKKDKKLSKAFACPESVLSQAKCDYCGGVYVVGHHTTCPFCQAQLPFDGSDYNYSTVADVKEGE